MERLSVLGLFDTFGRYPELIPLRRRLAREYIADPPDIFIGVDAPDFNLPIEAKVRKAGVPTVHYACPSVWAWRRYRLRKIRRAVDLILTLFPFEEEFMRSRGVAARFVGHPLADMIPDVPDQLGARRRLGLPPEGLVVAILPGSRITAANYLAEPMVQTAIWLAERRPELRFVVPLINSEVRARFEQVLAAYPGAPDMQLVDGGSMPAMTAADVVMLVSGTGTLEAMLLKRPMVVTFRSGWLSWRIANWMVDIPYVALPNLLAGKTLVPELLQDDAVPEKLGTSLLRFLNDPDLTGSLLKEYQRIHDELRNDADERAADAVLELLGVDDSGA
jgi:lipid-A-disaccharide synthase